MDEEIIEPSQEWYLERLAAINALISQIGELPFLLGIRDFLVYKTTQ